MHFLTIKHGFFIAFCFKKHFLGQKRSKRDKIANVKASNFSQSPNLSADAVRTSARLQPPSVTLHINFFNYLIDKCLKFDNILSPSTVLAMAMWMNFSGSSWSYFFIFIDQKFFLYINWSEVLIFYSVLLWNSNNSFGGDWKTKLQDAYDLPSENVS